MIRKFGFIFILLWISILSARQDYTVSYLLSYPQTSVQAAREPFRWNIAEWKTTAGFVFIAGSLYLFDDEINDLVQRNRSSFTGDISLVAKQFGEGKYMLPALGLTYAGGLLLKSAKTQDTALLSLKSFLLANGMSLSLKHLTQRQRPVSGEGKQFWSSSGFSRQRESFPSGHTTVVWSVAPILAKQYQEVRWVPPAVYSIAILTSVSRIHDEKHWASDVFSGAVIGYLTSQLVLKTTPRLSLAPASNLSGLQLNWNF